MQTQQNITLQKINSSLQYTLIKSLKEIEETTQDLHSFFKNAAAKSFAGNGEYAESIATHRIEPIKKLYYSQRACPQHGPDCFKNLIIEQTKKTLTEMEKLPTEEKKKYIFRKALSHEDLINCLKSLYPNRPHFGICHGFALMGLQAILTNRLDQFEARLKKLAFLLTMRSENGDVSKVIREIQDLDLLAFFEGLEICSRGHEYNDLFTEETHPRSQLHVQFINSILAIIASNELENVAIVKTDEEEPSKEIRQVAQTSGAYSLAELSKYFHNLQATIEHRSVASAPIAFLIKNLKHTCIIGYDPQKNIWTFIDANLVFPYKTKNIDQLVEHVHKGLNTDNYRHTFMHTSVLTTKNEAKLWENLLSLWKKNPTFIKIHRISKQTPLKNGARLLVASRYNDIESTKALLRKKINVDSQIPPYLTTPLFTAASQGHIESVAAFLNAGADIDKPCTDEETPLFSASKIGHRDVVRILVEKGADIHKCDKNGKTPLSIAQENRHREIVQILMEADSRKRKRTIDFTEDSSYEEKQPKTFISETVWI